MDPGRGDIFHCMHEMSTPMDPKVFRLSCKQCNKERRLGHFADVQEKSKQKAQRKQPFVDRMPESHPLRWKLHLSVYWNKVQADDQFAKGLHCLKSVAKYKDSTRARMWNRDTAAVLNFRHILQSLWESGCVLERFQRPMRKQPDKTNTKRPLPSDSDDSDSDSGQLLIELLQGAAFG
ncbi:hypothetical protein COEREDRAFT_7108 [Coemansia reversa NRRL 1564]|uniref:Uncharacterized protein n=1 Tax=Coemansia reversa (strain ATCC 12441 / NRRL 1564) TaxID=763665 RepID=A0A2G5BFX3_COERN|nr:hypothetical protein COEREDRAFT_7108 [Coemansia reversa NRRL 1564]|eukprot:PIA17928.1 hypothetical protein COEREDRAFT_7108 [Coemansia reversa NRRL 1564]